MDWVTAFTLWLTLQGIPIDGVSGQGAAATIWYKPSATTQQHATAEAAKLTFVAPPIPDLYTFKATIVADQGIPPAAEVELATFAGAITDLVAANNVAGLQGLWAAVKATSAGTPLAGNCTDTAGGTIFDRIEAYAKANNVPLTP